MTDKLVSIIVLAYDNPNYLLRSVETLYRHNFYEPFELIVSHNPCGTGDDQRIEEACNVWKKNWNNFKYVRNKENLYHAKGTMEGFKLAVSGSNPDYVCFCNDDVFIPASQSGWLINLVKYIEENPEVATLTPSIYSEKERIYWVGKDDPKSPYHNLLHVPRGDPRIPKDPIETCYNNMAICLTRRHLVDEIPLGQSCPHYGSDSEFGNRIKEKYPEMKHMVFPEVKLYHYNIYAKRTNYKKDKTVEG